MPSHGGGGSAMALYKNVSMKRIMLAGVQWVHTLVPHPLSDPVRVDLMPNNRWVEVGEDVELSEAQAQALAGRVALVDTP